jgi:hypothetical protein
MNRPRGWQFVSSVHARPWWSIRAVRERAREYGCRMGRKARGRGEVLRMDGGDQGWWRGAQPIPAIQAIDLTSLPDDDWVVGQFEMGVA